MIRAVIFDLFHTLVDPEEYRPRNFRRAEVLADLLGVDIAEFTAYWEKTATLRYSTRSPSVDYVEDFIGKSGVIPDKTVLAEADEIIGRYQDLAILNPREDILDSLSQLKEKGMRIGLLSNAEEREVRSWSRSSLAPFFDFAAFSYETGKLKPNLAAYQLVLDKLQVDPSLCAYVGDGGSQELLGARRANFARVVFMRYFVSRNGIHSQDAMQEFVTQADVLADDFREFPTLFG